MSGAQLNRHAIAAAGTALAERGEAALARLAALEAHRQADRAARAAASRLARRVARRREQAS